MSKYTVFDSLKPPQISSLKGLKQYLTGLIGKDKILCLLRCFRVQILIPNIKLNMGVLVLLLIFVKSLLLSSDDLNHIETELNTK